MNYPYYIFGQISPRPSASCHLTLAPSLKFHSLQNQSSLSCLLELQKDTIRMGGAKVSSSLPISLVFSLSDKIDAIA
jgi:hypothetical protein